jgi:hypothetical protein
MGVPAKSIGQVHDQTGEMRGTPIAIVSGIALWVLWCYAVIELIVPALRRHITFWDPALALVCCLLPVCVAAALVVLRRRKTTGAR